MEDAYNIILYFILKSLSFFRDSKVLFNLSLLDIFIASFLFGIVIKAFLKVPSVAHRTASNSVSSTVSYKDGKRIESTSYTLRKRKIGR